MPLAGAPRLAFVASNIDAFGNDWSLPAADLHFALALREVVHGAQRSVPWVRERLVRHSTAYVGGYELRLDALAQQFEMFANIDMSDPSTFENIELPDPGTVLDTMQTPAQQPILEELQRFAAVLEGYADTVVDTVGEPLIPSLTQIEEALRRHRVDRGRAAGRRPDARARGRARSLRAGSRLLPRCRRTGRARRPRPAVGVGGDGPARTPPVRRMPLVSARAREFALTVHLDLACSLVSARG